MGLIMSVGVWSPLFWPHAAYEVMPVPELWPFGTGLAVQDWLAARRG